MFLGPISTEIFDKIFTKFYWEDFGLLSNKFNSSVSKKSNLSVNIISSKIIPMNSSIESRLSTLSDIRDSIVFM